MGSVAQGFGDGGCYEGGSYSHLSPPHLDMLIPQSSTMCMACTENVYSLLAPKGEREGRGQGKSSGSVMHSRWHFVALPAASHLRKKLETIARGNTIGVYVCVRTNVRIGSCYGVSWACVCVCMCSMCLSGLCSSVRLHACECVCV